MKYFSATILLICISATAIQAAPREVRFYNQCAESWLKLKCSDCSSSGQQCTEWTLQQCKQCNLGPKAALNNHNAEDRIKITDGCIRVGAKANGKHINTGSLRTDSARACQKLCEDLDGCEFFRWRDQDMKAKWRLRRRCYLLREKKDVNKRHNWSWGPKTCPM